MTTIASCLTSCIDHVLIHHLHTTPTGINHRSTRHLRASCLSHHEQQHYMPLMLSKHAPKCWTAMGLTETSNAAQPGRVPQQQQFEACCRTPAGLILSQFGACTQHIDTNRCTEQLPEQMSEQPPGQLPQQFPVLLAVQCNCQGPVPFRQCGNKLHVTTVSVSQDD